MADEMTEVAFVLVSGMYVTSCMWDMWNLQQKEQRLSKLFSLLQENC